MTARAKEAVARRGYRGDGHRNESVAAGNQLSSLKLEEALTPARMAPGQQAGGAWGACVFQRRMDRAVITGHYLGMHGPGETGETEKHQPKNPTKPTKNDTGNPNNQCGQSFALYYGEVGLNSRSMLINAPETLDRSP